LKAGSAIENANLVRTVGLASMDDGLPALVMQYYEGETLEGYLKSRRTPRQPTAFKFAFHVIGAIAASALAALHEQGIIHRDVKPANIVIEKTGIPILMDLGTS
jgi:eukaryotic-like serine/threonine-protein kinase